MTAIVNVRFAFRRDTAANWASVNPVLADGEAGYDKTNRLIRIGDGTSHWSALPNFGSGVTSFNTRTGAVTLTSGDVTTALGYTPTTTAGAVSAVAAAATGVVKSNGTALSTAGASDITGALGYTPFNRAGDTATKIATGGTQSAAAWTTNGLVITQPAATYTDTTSSGTVANVYANALLAPTLAASSTTTYTESYTLYIEAPIAGANATLPNRYALGVASLRVKGTASIDGAVNCASMSCPSTINLVNSTAGTLTATIAGAALASGGNRTVNIGTAGLSGSITSILLGSGAGTVNIYQSQQAPASIGAAATLTAANIAFRLINYTGAAAALTMPLGSALDTGNAAMAVDTSLDFSVINTGSGTATMTANTGVTIVGVATVAAGSSALFRLRKTATATYILYRLT